MKGWIFLFIGFISAGEVVYKLIKCASCNTTYLGIEMSGYIYLVIQILIATLLLYSGYVEKFKKNASE